MFGSQAQAPGGGPELLGPGDPSPVGVVNPDSRSPFLLIGDHAGNRVPARLGDLGLPASELARHIGIDIGIERLGIALAARLDASFVFQRYSRLVIDCNRDPAQATAMPEVSDATVIPGNRSLTDEARARRTAAIHQPYHAAIAGALARADRAGGQAILVALHSFTPVMGGRARPWHCGVLHDQGDTACARAVLAALRQEPDLMVGDNEPYAMAGTDHTVPRHAYPSRRPYVELEVRQDLLADEAGCAAWADRLARILTKAATSG